MSRVKGTLWVISLGLGLPRLHVWPLREERPSCYIVDHRGDAKVLKKGTSGRQYFLAEDEALACLRRYYAAERSTAARQVARLDCLACQDDAAVLAYARGVEEVVVRVEAEARDRPGGRA